MKSVTINNIKTKQAAKKAVRLNNIARVVVFCALGTLGCLGLNSFNSTSAIHSFEETEKLFSLLTPDFKTTNPIGSCPFNLSAIPSTEHSATD